MKSTISYRKRIPFFCHKSEADFQADMYERYDDMVLRQVALHLGDELWGHYPMQHILDFAKDFYPSDPDQYILEVGWGVGRWIAHLAQRFPESTCWGIDYSYQMLKQANRFWVEGYDISLDVSNKGFDSILLLKGHQFKNLSFGLADAVDLPFYDDSQDLIVNSFLLDRLEDPIRSLHEMFRILKPGGKLIMVTPLNFRNADLWDALYPVNKIKDILIEIGFSILAWQEDLQIIEPLDAHGNSISWKCLGVVVTK